MGLREARRLVCSYDAGDSSLVHSARLVWDCRSTLLLETTGEFHVYG